VLYRYSIGTDDGVADYVTGYAWFILLSSPPFLPCQQPYSRTLLPSLIEVADNHFSLVCQPSIYTSYGSWSEGSSWPGRPQHMRAGHSFVRIPIRTFTVLFTIPQILDLSQVLRIDNLFFNMDTIRISPKSVVYLMCTLFAYGLHHIVASQHVAV
jgi:hypothetical protein